MSQTGEIISTETVQVSPPKEFKEVGVFPTELPRAEEYLQGRAWTLREFLNSFTCKATFLPNDLGIVVTLTRDATIGDAFEVLDPFYVLTITENGET